MECWPDFDDQHPDRIVAGADRNLLRMWLRMIVCKHRNEALLKSEHEC